MVGQTAKSCNWGITRWEISEISQAKICKNNYSLVTPGSAGNAPQLSRWQHHVRRSAGAPRQWWSTSCQAESQHVVTLWVPDGSIKLMYTYLRDCMKYYVHPSHWRLTRNSIFFHDDRIHRFVSFWAVSKPKHCVVHKGQIGRRTWATASTQPKMDDCGRSATLAFVSQLSYQKS